ncbi:pyridoxal phosphate enzyme (YggS family) [Ereboglobus sp. PH5-10]|uniref:YggS family pyridoxal phosphate-dependent enzyme n=1 Tax=Ereboglobus sp. PH5-10 TaxID=2940629 RepID=UPI002404A574|nr:YggS family pyridoxal phosphate-dependent enzyme [Ereboglobus sp. PH5-10]MDF9828421.1 pyridoxal phosphate enzyme (YggS family) [Ereboglobus sp. PH5-10]
MITFEQYKVRADALREQMAEACRSAGRDPSEVRLLAVTKTHDAWAVDHAARLGLALVGENRVQEAASKKPLVSPETAAAMSAGKLKWELIGHLQSNKARLAAELFDRVQSVDGEKLLRHLDRAAGELGKTLPILLQINAGNDPAKFGAEPADAPRLLDTALALPHLRVDGLMTIAPLSENPGEMRQMAVRTFANLRAIRDNLAATRGTALRELSMGMTGDYKEAIAAGSTIIRVGTALYGARE